jgi:signal transduction histidine kinase/CheY-like chemotaxis protein
MFLPGSNEITNKVLALRLIATLGILFGVAGATIYQFSAILIDRINQGERESLFAAIESGPLQLARLNSGELASTYLNRLGEEAHRQNPSIVGAEIVSGPSATDRYAVWTSELAPKVSCSAKVAKSVEFPDGMNPFIMRLTIDRCATRQPLARMQQLCLAVGVLLVVMTGLACLLAGLPVFRSLRQVARMLDFGNAGTADDLTKICYLPLRNLGNKVLENRKLELQATVARMTQMLVHDVRKPFSILRMGLNMLGNAKDPESVKQVLSRLVPEVDKAVRNADGLIADVMEVGSPSTQLIQEPTTPEALIEAAIADLCRIYPNANINLSYDFRHTKPVLVHVRKIARVFSNILGNAVQAMMSGGEIWFKTRDANGFVEFCIGNSGSVISPEHLPKLFDAFFTSGKKGGTGLGLAIAQKVIAAHGGTIWCESSVTPEQPDGKVEFFFTLPVSTAAAAPKFLGVLPRHTSDVSQAFDLAQTDQEAKQVTGVSSAELELEVDIQTARAELARPIGILIVDDEDVYRQGLHGSMTRVPELAAALAIDFAPSSTEALAKIKAQAFDLLITDVDLGLKSINGFELVQEIRTLMPSCMICVHSNRLVAEDNKLAIACGADAFLPKPMAREHLLKLILQATQRALADGEAFETAGLPSAKPEVAIVEDNPFMLGAWSNALATDSTVHAVDSPEALAEMLLKDPVLGDRLACVVTDYYFDNSTQNGIDVARMIKARSPDLPVLLSSDGHISAAEMANVIDQVIPKDPQSYAGLTKRFELRNFRPPHQCDASSKDPRGRPTATIQR